MREHGLSYQAALNRMEADRPATSDGVELTDDVIQRLADEAEQGYDLEQFIASASPEARRGIENTIASIRVYNELAEKLADGEAPPTSLLAGSILLVSNVHVPQS